MLDQVVALVGDAALTVLAAPNAVPDPGPGQAPPGAESILMLLSWAKWIFTAAAVGGAIWIGSKMVLAHRRGDDANVSSLGFWLAGCVLAGAAPHLVGALI